MKVQEKEASLAAPLFSLTRGSAQQGDSHLEYFLGHLTPQKRELSLRTGSAQNKVSYISTIATESTQENHANVMSILLDTCPSLLPQAYYTDRGACLFLGDAMTTFSFLEIHDTLALAKKGRPPTNGYLIIFNHISSSSEMGPLIDTFLFSMMDI